MNNLLEIFVEISSFLELFLFIYGWTVQNNKRCKSHSCMNGACVSVFRVCLWHSYLHSLLLALSMILTTSYYTGLFSLAFVIEHTRRKKRTLCTKCDCIGGNVSESFSLFGITFSRYSFFLMLLLVFKQFWKRKENSACWRCEKERNGACA